MKRLCSAVALVVLTAGCASTPPPVGDQSARQAPVYTHDDAHDYAHDDAYNYTTRTATSSNSPSKPPRLSVGVSDPNTQLILPWFLTDLINLVNDP